MQFITIMIAVHPIWKRMLKLETQKTAGFLAILRVKTYRTEICSAIFCQTLDLLRCFSYLEMLWFQYSIHSSMHLTCWRQSIIFVCMTKQRCISKNWEDFVAFKQYCSNCSIGWSFQISVLNWSILLLSVVFWLWLNKWIDNPFYFVEKKKKSNRENLLFIHTTAGLVGHVQFSACRLEAIYIDKYKYLVWCYCSLSAFNQISELTNWVSISKQIDEWNSLMKIQTK